MKGKEFYDGQCKDWSFGAGYRELFPILGSSSLLKIVTSLISIASHFHNIGYRLYCKSDKMNSKPLVSIIIPVYNSELTIGKCLTSVLDQTYTNYEVIAVDDCSTDGSKEIIKDFKGKFAQMTTLFNPENKGASITRNRGIEIAKKKYIAFLDSDCYPIPEWLSIGVQFMEKNIEVSAIMGSVFYYKRNLLSALLHITEFGGMQRKKIRKLNRMGSLNVLIRNNVFSTIDKWFDPELRRSHDVELFFRIYQSGHRFLYYPEFKVYHDHPVKGIKEYFRFIKKEGIGYFETRTLMPSMPYNFPRSKLFFAVSLPLFPFISTVKKIINGHEKKMIPYIPVLLPLLFIGQVYFWVIVFSKLVE